MLKHSQKYYERKRIEDKISFGMFILGMVGIFLCGFELGLRFA